MLPVSLDCPFLIAPLVFCSAYLLFRSTILPQNNYDVHYLEMSLDVHFLLPLRYSITFIFNIKVTWNLRSKGGILMTEWLYIHESIFIFCLLKIGKNYTIALTVYNLGSNSTCDNISLHDTSGNVISPHDASQFKTEMSTICSATIGIPDVVSISLLISLRDIVSVNGLTMMIKLSMICTFFFDHTKRGNKTP